MVVLVDDSSSSSSSCGSSGRERILHLHFGFAYGHCARWREGYVCSIFPLVVMVVWWIVLLFSGPTNVVGSAVVRQKHKRFSPLSIRRLHSCFNPDFHPYCITINCHTLCRVVVVVVVVVVVHHMASGV